MRGKRGTGAVTTSAVRSAVWGFKTGGRTALDFVFPPLCPKCHTRVSEPYSLCPACWSAISFLDGALCVRCGVPFDIDPGGETLCGPCHAKPNDFDRARRAP